VKFSFKFSFLLNILYKSLRCLNRYIYIYVCVYIYIYIYMLQVHEAGMTRYDLMKTAINF
jgi:hypothetical protein